MYLSLASMEVALKQGSVTGFSSPGGPPVQAHTHTPAGGNALVVGPEGVVLKGVAALLVVGLGHFLALFNGGGVEILAPAVAEGGQQKQIVVDPADSGGRHGRQKASLASPPETEIS